MDLTIHTYGHIDSMFYVLNSIAILMNHTFGHTVILVMMMSSIAYYALRMSYSGSAGYKIYLAKVAGMVAMVYFMLLPRADMVIYDHVNKKRDTVSNLPIGFALPVGILEAFGDLLTAGFEQAFNIGNNTNYRDYGMVFGARLIQESRSWRIRSPEFLENMGNFIDRCVMLDAMIGYHYTPEELLKSEDVWSLVKTNAATLRYTSVRQGKSRSLMSCKEAADNVIDPAFRLEIEALDKKSRRTDSAEAGNTTYVLRAFKRLTSNFKKNVQLSFSNYLKTDANAEQLIRQQMMINAIKNYSDDYGYARAAATQESNWRIAGDLAGTYLPILMSVLKGLVYSSFIFMIPVLIMGGGWMKYLSYLTLVASFQLWAPLNSVLNMFIELYSSSTLSGIADKVVSFSTMSRIGNYTDKIVAVASGLQMAIPFLAFSIIQGGVGGFINLASTITGASQSAASQAANESVTGNKSYDNYSAGNRQLYSQGGFKTDWNESYAAGASSYQHMDGMMERVTGGGNTLMQSGAGFNISSGARSLINEKAKSTNLSEGYTQGLSAMQGLEQHFQESKTATISNTTDRVSHLAQRQAAGKSNNIDLSTDKGRTMQHAINNTIALHDKEGYGWSQAASSTVTAYADGSIKTPDNLPLVKASAGVRVDGSVSASNTSDQSLNKDSSINREKGTSHSLNTLMRAASNESYTKDDIIDQSLANNTKASYDKMQSYGSALSQKREEVENYSAALQATQHKAATDRSDMTHEVENRVMQQYGVSRDAAHRMVQSSDPRAERVWNAMVAAETAKELAQVRASRQQINNRAARDSTLFYNEHSGKVNNQGQIDLQKAAAKEGLDANLMNAKIQKTQEHISNKQNEMTENANNQIHSVEQSNTVMEGGMNNKIKEFEKDRIGQGKFGSSLGIGAPTLEHREEEYLQGGGEKAVQIPSPQPLKPTKGKK